jgi:hypothetical protein
VVEETVMASDHIFDILGVGGREDQYTNLIAYAFDKDPDFRANLLNLLLSTPNNSDDWKTRMRLPVKISSNRVKDQPDLIIYSRSEQKIIVIENKVFSGEGESQTKRYASKEFRESPTFKSELGISTPVFFFYYLTLEDEKPSSDDFKRLSYKDIANLILTQVPSQEKLCVLLQEFRERVLEYYSWPPPRDNQEVLTYLNSHVRLISARRAFHAMTSGMPIEHDLEGSKRGNTSVTGKGSEYWCQFFKESWIRNNDEIHFELVWRAYENSLSVELHYEKNDNGEDKQHRARREEFRRKLQTNTHLEQAGWQLEKSMRSKVIGRHPFESSIKFGDFCNITQVLFRAMTPSIDHTLGASALT